MLIFKSLSHDFNYDYDSIFKTMAYIENPLRGTNRLNTRNLVNSKFNLNLKQYSKLGDSKFNLNYVFPSSKTGYINPLYLAMMRPWWAEIIADFTPFPQKS